MSITLIYIDNDSYRGEPLFLMDKLLENYLKVLASYSTLIKVISNKKLDLINTIPSEINCIELTPSESSVKADKSYEREVINQINRDDSCHVVFNFSTIDLSVLAEKNPRKFFVQHLLKKDGLIQFKKRSFLIPNLLFLSFNRYVNLSEISDVSKIEFINLALPVHDLPFSIHPQPKTAYWIGDFRGKERLEVVIKAAIKSKFILHVIENCREGSNLKNHLKPFLHSPYLHYYESITEEEYLFIKNTSMVFVANTDEHYKMAIIEALGHGTPAIYPEADWCEELLTQNTSVRIMDGTIDEYCQAFSKSEFLNRVVCRLRAEDYFSTSKFAVKIKAICEQREICVEGKNDNVKRVQ